MAGSPQFNDPHSGKGPKGPEPILPAWVQVIVIASLFFTMLLIVHTMRAHKFFRGGPFVHQH